MTRTSAPLTVLPRLMAVKPLLIAAAMWLHLIVAPLRPTSARLLCRLGRHRIKTHTRKWGSSTLTWRFCRRDGCGHLAVRQVGA